MLPEIADSTSARCQTRGPRRSAPPPEGVWAQCQLPERSENSSVNAKPLSSAQDARGARSAAVPFPRGNSFLAVSRLAWPTLPASCRSDSPRWTFRSRTIGPRKNPSENPHTLFQSADTTSARGETRRRRIRAATRQAHRLKPARPRPNTRNRWNLELSLIISPAARRLSAASRGA